MHEYSPVLVSAFSIFIGTSTDYFAEGVLTDQAKGKFASETIYHDNDVAQIESLPPTQIHRNVDLDVVKADTDGTWRFQDMGISAEVVVTVGYVRSYIILPSTIYGIATGKLVDLGLQNPHSDQVPGLIRTGIARGQAGVVAEGKSIWNHVHIQESKCIP